MAWLVELRSPANKSASVKDGVGLGLALGPTTLASPISTFSAKLANCWRLYSCILVKPWIGPGGSDWTEGSGGGTFGGLEVGGITYEGSPSNEDCIDAGRDIGELVLIELGHPPPIVLVWTIGCELVTGIVDVVISGVAFLDTLLSVRNLPNESYDPKIIIQSVSRLDVKNTGARKN